MERVMEAAAAGNINALYETIKSNPAIFDEIDHRLFVHTPLHVAAKAGHTRFAVEIMTLKPSFGRKLNPDGYSPLHLALQNHQPETARRLSEIDAKLVRVKGREGVTPLHYVAGSEESEVSKDYLDLLAEFLSGCPESVQDVTVSGETVLHIAVAKRREKATGVLLEWIWRTYNRQVLNATDDEGNTVMHLAASTNQTKVVKLLLKKAPMTKNEKNLKHQTARDIAISGRENTKEVEKILARANAPASPHQKNDSSTSSLADYLISQEELFDGLLRGIMYWRRDLSMDMRKVVLVVAVLIATATFQAVIRPPTGNGSNESTNTTITNTTTLLPSSLLPRDINITITNNPFLKVLFTPYENEKLLHFCFYALNTTAFAASIMVIIIVLQWRPFSTLLHMSLYFLVVSYGIALFLFLSPPFAAGYMTTMSIVAVFGSYYCKIFFWKIEMHMKSKVWRSEFAFIWMPLYCFWVPISNNLDRRLGMLNRLMGT